MTILYWSNFDTYAVIETDFTVARLEPADEIWTVPGTEPAEWFVADLLLVGR